MTDERFSPWLAKAVYLPTLTLTTWPTWTACTCPRGATTGDS